MADKVTKETRSRMMASVRSKDTKPEMVIRRALHAKGLRYRLHDRKLPGSPDLVFPKYRTVLFVHGCFWHAHDCGNFKWPKSNADWWKRKLETNRSRDKETEKSLLQSGWKVATVFECALQGDGSLEPLIPKIMEFIVSSPSRHMKSTFP
jgi:DNA mismatch endonuclease (patch repair protein)